MSEAVPFVRKRRFEWVDYPTEPITNLESGEVVWTPDPEYTGFRVRVYANPTMEEVRHELKLWESMRDGAEANEWDYLTDLSWRIANWNYVAETSDGESADVPPPADDPHSMYLLPAPLFWWVITQMRTSHLPKGPEAMPSTPSPSAGTTDTSTRKTTSRAETPRTS